MQPTILRAPYPTVALPVRTQAGSLPETALLTSPWPSSTGQVSSPAPSPAHLQARFLTQPSPTPALKFGYCVNSQTSANEATLKILFDSWSMRYHALAALGDADHASEQENNQIVDLMLKILKGETLTVKTGVTGSGEKALDENGTPESIDLKSLLNDPDKQLPQILLLSLEKKFRSKNISEETRQSILKALKEVNENPSDHPVFRKGKNKKLLQEVIDRLEGRQQAEEASETYEEAAHLSWHAAQSEDHHDGHSHHSHH
jgi:hypothetical protein